MWLHILAFFWSPTSTFNLAAGGLLSRKTAEAAPSLQQNLGTLAFHFQKKKGGSRMGFFHYKNGRAGISTNLKKVWKWKGDFFFGGGDFDDFGDMGVFFSNLKPSMFLFLCVQEWMWHNEPPPRKQSRWKASVIWNLRHGSHDVVGGKRWSYAPSLMACRALGSRLWSSRPRGTWRLWRSLRGTLGRATSCREGGPKMPGKPWEGLKGGVK